MLQDYLFLVWTFVIQCTKKFLEHLKVMWSNEFPPLWQKSEHFASFRIPNDSSHVCTGWGHCFYLSFLGWCVMPFHSPLFYFWKKVIKPTLVTCHVVLNKLNIFNSTPFQQLWGNIFTMKFALLHHQVRNSGGMNFPISQTFHHLLDGKMLPPPSIPIPAAISLTVMCQFSLTGSSSFPIFLSVEAVHRWQLGGWLARSVFPTLKCYHPFNVSICTMWISSLIGNSITACGQNNILTSQFLTLKYDHMTGTGKITFILVWVIAGTSHPHCNTVWHLLIIAGCSWLSAYPSHTHIYHTTQHNIPEVNNLHSH